MMDFSKLLRTSISENDEEVNQEVICYIPANQTSKHVEEKTRVAREVSVTPPQKTVLQLYLPIIHLIAFKYLKLDLKCSCLIKFYFKSASCLPNFV